MSPDDAPPITELHAWIVTTSEGGEVIMPFLNGPAISPDKIMIDSEVMRVLARDYAMGRKVNVRLQTFQATAWHHGFTPDGAPRR